MVAFTITPGRNNIVMIKPLIKRSHHVILSDDGDICIGELPGSSKIIKKPPGWVKAVLSKLDGIHTIPRILKAVSLKGYDINDSDIMWLINQLNNHGLIDDNACYSDILTSEEIELYDRQLLQFSVVDKNNNNAIKYQEKLKKSRVLILGMGGWGTWCSLQLAVSGIGILRIVDGDDVELSNLNRQILYTPDDIGRKKTDAASDSLKQHNKYVTVEKYPVFATTDENQLSELLDDVNLVLLAWASLGYYRKNTVEESIHRLAHINNIPVVELGGDPFDISVGPVYLNNGNGLNYSDVKKQAGQHYYGNNADIKKFRKARMKQQFLNGNRVVNAWQSAPSLAAMSGLITDQVVKILTGYDAPALEGKKWHLNLRDFSVREVTI
ncbi:ThiF family adenylyltransferase [Morganella morganii subsp. morganii]|nr:ThiF family adenylyltransferase [Morganella morganii subsp. morganii]